MAADLLSDRGRDGHDHRSRRPRGAWRTAPHRRRARVWPAAVVVACAFGAVACSGSTTSGSAPPPSATGPAGTSGPTGPAGPSGGTTAPARPPDTRGTSVAAPQIAGPLTGGTRGAAFGAMPKALADAHGYVEEEFTLTGTATAYVEEGAVGTDGVWSVRPTTTAVYTTRVLIRRPADPARFDGTAVVEWLNVSAGQDSDVVFTHTHDSLLAHGTVWVGVSAQAVGVQGGGPSMPMPGLDAKPLRTWDPERYSSLAHPGDDYSYDIYSQVASALRRPTGPGLLGGGRVTTLLAVGQSQSASRLVTYVDAVHPLARIYDGFLLDGRSFGGSILHAPTPSDPPRPAFAHIRPDLDVPVLQFETETDVLGLPFLAARQPDTDKLRTWEIAGAAHLDRDMLDYLGATAPFEGACGRINEGPHGPVLAKAVDALRSWATGGPAPAHGEPLEVQGEAYVRDALGIVKGGIRTPPVDAPATVVRGDAPASSGYVCSLFGSTATIDPATLARLYPSTTDYVAAVRTSAERARDAGFLLPADAEAYIAAAARGPGATTAGSTPR